MVRLSKVTAEVRGEMDTSSASAAPPESDSIRFLALREWIFLGVCVAIAVVGAIGWLTGLFLTAAGSLNSNPVSIALYACFDLWPLAATAALVGVSLAGRRRAESTGDHALGWAWLAAACFFGILGGSAGIVWLLLWLLPVLFGNGVL